MAIELHIKMIQAWMIIQFRNTMHRNGVNLAEKKSSFHEFKTKENIGDFNIIVFHKNIVKCSGYPAFR